MKIEKLKVLAICSAGLNRSKYLAQYLRRKGYSTRFRGLEPEKYPDMKINAAQQKDIDWADVIITVRPRLKEAIKNIIVEFQESQLPALIRRHYDIRPSKEFINVLWIRLLL